MEPTIAAAVVAAVGAVLVALLQRSRKENKDDHAVVVQSIRLVHEDVKEVRRDVHRHLTWHAGGNTDDGTKQRNQDAAKRETPDTN